MSEPTTLYVWSKLSAAKWADAWEEVLSSFPGGSYVISGLPSGKTVRVEVYCLKKSATAPLVKEYGGSVRTVKKQNWAAISAESLKPIRIGSSMVITHSEAEWTKQREAHPDRIVLCIPGELAFGTGDHPTTATCLRLMLDFAARRQKAGKPWSMLDLGCGTGILALAAARLGAAPVAGCDHDAAAVRISKKNATLNKVRGIAWSQQDILQWKPAAAEKADLVIANIFYDVLTMSFRTIRKAMKPGAELILSGILHTHADDCLAAGREAGFEFPTVIRKGKWVTASGHLR